ncbi:MAG TPA: response regulator [Actinomycetota bacterium]|nr:response regulator [Actinomycetota bacterium]
MDLQDELRRHDSRDSTGSVLLCGTGQFESEMLRRALQRASFRVVYAHDVDAAVLAVLGGTVDAVIVGDSMAPAPRVALIRWIRGSEGIERTPIVFLAEKGDPASAVRAYDAGVDMVVEKPVDVDLLGRKLGAVIRRAGPRRRAGGA